MKKFNITTQGTYQKNGEEKKTYPPVGKLVYFEANGDKEDGYIIELNMFPNTKFYVFADDRAEKKIEDTGNFVPDVNQPIEDMPF